MVKSKDEETSFLCLVRLLDEAQTPLEITIEKDSIGELLFDLTCERIGGLQEKDYFGLRYVDKEKQRQWLDLRRNAFKQLRFCSPISVSFRVKHYPISPLEDLKQEMSRYFLFLQLKRDLLHGRLICQQSDAIELASLIVQAEFGDQDEQELPDKYLTNVPLIHNQSPKLEAKIIEAHKTLSGLVPSDVEARFLEKAAKLDTYGVDPYAVKDQKGNNLFIGLTHQGVVTFQGSRRTHLFKWEDITKFNYENKLYILHVTLKEDTPYQRKTFSPLAYFTKKHVLGFKCESKHAAAALWRWSYDRQAFFTLDRSSEARTVKSGGGLFSRSNSYRFSGRSQRELFSVSQNFLDRQPSFQRRATSFTSLSGKRKASNRTLQLRSSMSFDDGKFNTLPRDIKLASSQEPSFAASVKDGNVVDDATLHVDSFLATSTPRKSSAIVDACNGSGEKVVQAVDVTTPTTTTIEDLIVHRQDGDIVETEENEVQHVHEDIVGERKICSVAVEKPISLHDEKVESDDLGSPLRNGRAAVLQTPQAATVNAAPADSKDSKAVTKGKVAAAAVLWLSFLTVVGVVFLFEAELTSSAPLRSLRALALVQDFRATIYGPMRARLFNLFAAAMSSNNP